MQHWCLNVIRTDKSGAIPAALLILALLSPSLMLSTSASAQPSGLFGSSRPSFLDVDEAFKFYTSLDSTETISIHWTVAPEYYLYQDKFSFSLLAPGGNRHELLAEMPAGINHHDEFFGDVEVYYNTLTTTISLPASVNSDSYQLQIQYQGCADAGLCYPPQTRLLEISP